MSNIKEYLFEKLEELADKYDFTYEEVLDYYDAMGGLDIKIDPIEFLDGFLKWKRERSE